MNLLTIIFIALALAMDAFAVAIASGITIKRLHLKHAFTIAAWFGAFQAIMPILGWLGGVKLKAFTGGIDHWIAFGLLCFVGCKMIYEAFRIETIEKKTDPLNIYVLFILSISHQHRRACRWNQLRPARSVNPHAGIDHRSDYFYHVICRRFDR